MRLFKKDNINQELIYQSNINYISEEKKRILDSLEILNNAINSIKDESNITNQESSDIINALHKFIINLKMYDEVTGKTAVNSTLSKLSNLEQSFNVKKDLSQLKDTLLIMPTYINASENKTLCKLNQDILENQRYYEKRTVCNIL